MKSTRTKMRIIIAIIVSVLVIGLISILISFKPKKRIESKKEELWEYVFSKSTASIISSFLDGENYSEILKNKKYESASNITFEVRSEEEEKISEFLKNMEINIESKIDNETNQIMGSAKLEYLKNEIFKVDFIKDDKLYGIKSDEIIDRYLGIKNQNLDELAKMYGINTKIKEINTLNITDVMPSKETIDLLINSIKDVCNEKIDVNRFEKKKKVKIVIGGNEVDTDTYTMAINTNELIDIEETVIEKIANNTQIIDDLNTKLSLITEENNKLSYDKIKEILNKIKLSNYLHEESNKLTIYISEKKMVKLSLESGETEYILEIDEKNNKIGLYINVGDTHQEISIEKNKENTTILNVDLEMLLGGKLIVKSRTLDGSLKEGEVTNRIGINYNTNDDKNITIILTNKIKLVEKLEMENLSNTNCAFINDMSKNEFLNILSAIKDRIDTVYKEKIELIESGKLKQQLKPVSEEIERFNEQFKKYEGEYDSTVVVELLNLLIKNNNSSDYLIGLSTSLNKDDKTELKPKDITVEKVQPLANLLTTEAIYKIEIQYQPVSGVVNGVVITKKDENKEENDKKKVTIKEQE